MYTVELIQCYKSQSTANRGERTMTFTCLYARIFHYPHGGFPGGMWVALSVESQLRQSRATQPH